MTIPFTWSWGRVVGYSILIAVVFLAAQISAVVAVGVASIVLVRGFNPYQWNAANDGVVVIAATFAAAAACILLVRLLVGRHEPSPWKFLGLNPARGADVRFVSIVMLLFIAITDPINVWLLNRPLVPPFWLQVYASSRVPAMLFVVMAVVAPISEELLFRGFLFGVLRAKGLSAVWTVAVTSAAFTLVHTEYDLYDLLHVSIVGALLGWARVRYDSIIPSMTMHALSNAVAFVESALIMH